MAPRIDVSDSEEEDEETQLNVEEEEVEEEQQVAASSRVPCIAWLCFDKSTVFTKDGKEYIKCNQPRCNAVFKFNRTTATPLVRHIKKAHQSLLPSSSTKERYKQQILTLQKAKIMPAFSDQTLKEYLVEFVVSEDISFITIESSSFRNLIHLLRPGVFVPKADSLKNSIMSTFKTKLLQLRAFWASIDSRISFTTDIWSAPNDIPFMAITGHWIDPNFKLWSNLCSTIKYFFQIII